MSDISAAQLEQVDTLYWHLPMFRELHAAVQDEPTHTQLAEIIAMVQRMHDIVTER